MANTVSRPVRPGRGSRIAAFGIRPSGTRHPLVAVAMALPLAVLLAVVFGGWDAVVTQASSVAGLMGR
ncbi:MULTISPECIES: hypothetical protein [unclassified Streptomyces]|uniref:hypothetical protein n=1 Tax=unclassified Streptomyces TaxID=2593676 RepID=UPI0034095BCB